MPVRQKDAQRALELLQQYRLKLDQRQKEQSRSKQGPMEEDQQLQQSLDRVINVFQSQLFKALLDIQEYYELTILADSKHSVNQIEVPDKVAAPFNFPADASVQSPPLSAPLSPQAPGTAAQPKPITPKPRSLKYPAPPVPSASPTHHPRPCVSSHSRQNYSNHSSKCQKDPSSVKGAIEVSSGLSTNKDAELSKLPSARVQRALQRKNSPLAAEAPQVLLQSLARELLRVQPAQVG
ncbi:hypothetical protein OJAV_G00032840 [Oryzias javanicus]|uniref:L27 domain-containing protein n=1 Tax=Oryzias javanicus TaxID=123683 RepID=A0A3S2PH59_ORYJA|nr:hypothetical protein OJAV_G00032840 [Oryzias javanicus]